MKRQKLQEILLPSLNLILSQKQDFLEKYLAQMTITPCEQKIFEMRAEAFVSAGAKDMDTSGYGLSDWEENHIVFGKILKWSWMLS